MKVELFHAAGCGQCAAAQQRLKAVAQSTVAGLEWHEINVLDELEYAVELGVLSLPAIAVNGRLVFCALPTEAQLCAALARHARGGV